MTNPLLFALVDAVLESYVVTADMTAVLSDLSLRRRGQWEQFARDERENLGWWRSTWAGGGA